MIDIITLFCTSVLGFLVGHGWEKHILRKENLFQDLLEFATKFRTNIETAKLPLDNFVKQFLQVAGVDFAACCNKYLLGKQGKISLLKGRELQYVEKFFAGLNAQNCQQLSNHLNYFVAHFADALDCIKKENKTKGQIGQKIGLLCGVVVGLVLI